MRRFRVYMETPYAGQSPTEDFEVADSATDEEIEEEAREIFFSNFSYGFDELTDQEDAADE